jgi:hypothetical protein
MCGESARSSARRKMPFRARFLAGGLYPCQNQRAWQQRPMPAALARADSDAPGPNRDTALWSAHDPGEGPEHCEDACSGGAIACSRRGRSKRSPASHNADTSSESLSSNKHAFRVSIRRRLGPSLSESLPELQVRLSHCLSNPLARVCPLMCGGSIGESSPRIQASGLGVTPIRVCLSEPRSQVTSRRVTPSGTKSSVRLTIQGHPITADTPPPTHHPRSPWFPCAPAFQSPSPAD